MEASAIVSYARVESVFQTNSQTIIVLFPNYEDRTKGIINYLKRLVDIDFQKEAMYVLFCLKNKSNNNILLEDLKEHNIDIIKKTLGNAQIYEYWLEYPYNFSPNSLKAPLQSLLEELKIENRSSNTNVMIDISTAPKSVLFQLCENINEFIHRNLVDRIFSHIVCLKTIQKFHMLKKLDCLRAFFRVKHCLFLVITQYIQLFSQAEVGTKASFSVTQSTVYRHSQTILCIFLYIRIVSWIRWLLCKPTRL